MGAHQSRRGLSRLELEDEVASDLQRATGLADADAQDANRLNRVLQLTGAPLRRCCVQALLAVRTRLAAHWSLTSVSLFMARSTFISVRHAAARDAMTCTYPDSRLLRAQGWRTRCTRRRM